MSAPGQVQTLERPDNHSIERQDSARDWTFIGGSFEPRSPPRPGRNWAPLASSLGAALTPQTTARPKEASDAARRELICFVM